MTTPLPRSWPQATFSSKPPWLLLLALCAMTSGGCQRLGNRAYHEMMMDEKRLLEDQLYNLAYENEILQRKLKEFEHSSPGGSIPIEIEPQELEKINSGLSNAEPIEVLPAPTDNSPETIDPLDPNIDPSGEPPPLDPPTIDLPDSDPPSINTPLSTPVPNLAPPGNGGARVTRDGEGRVAEIRLDPVQTGGEDFDRQPGDDGVGVLIEPRGPRGEVLVQPAKVSVVVVDPALPNDQARIARWDLSEQEIAERLENTSTGKGIRLQLPWPQAKPQNSKLHLFVRYITNDGRKLEANREFFISLDGTVANRWTPRSRQNTARQTEPATDAPSASNRPSASSRSSSGTEPPAMATPSNSNASTPPPRQTPRQASRPQWRPTR